MAIGPHRVQVLKQESPALGGNASDEVEYPSPIEPEEDAIEACGIYFQAPGERDQTVYIERHTNGLRFRDQVVTTPKALSAIVSHAAEHSKTGSQPITAQNLSSGAALSGQMLQADGVGGWSLVSIVAGVPAELNEVASEPLSTTVSAAPQLKARLTTTNLPLGDYILFWSYITVGSNSNTQMNSRVRKDSATDLSSLANKANTAGAQYSNSGFSIQKNLSGVHTFDIEYWLGAGSGSSGIQQARMALWLIDN